MNWKNITLRHEGKSALITVNRPEKLNALDSTTHRELQEAFTGLDADKTVRAIIVTGSGKAFVSGADIAEMRSLSPDEARRFSRLGHQTMDLIQNTGKPVIAVLNPVDKAPTASKVFADNVVMGESTGSFLAQHMAGKQTNIVALPGPAGSGWAEQFAQGLKKAVAANKHLRLVDEKFGDTGVAVQLRLVQNALQANPDLNVLWGNATMIEGAIGALREANRKDVLLIAEYENQAMLDALKSGQILGFATQYPVLQGRIAVDLAIKALQKEKVPSFVAPVPAMVTTSTLPSINTSLVLAPASFQAVYSVAAPAK